MTSEEDVQDSSIEHTCVEVVVFVPTLQGIFPLLVGEVFLFLVVFLSCVPPVIMVEERISVVHHLVPQTIDLPALYHGHIVSRLASFHWQISGDKIIFFIVEECPCQLSIKFCDLDGALLKILLVILSLARVSIHQAGHPLSGIAFFKYPETRGRRTVVVDHEALGGFSVSDLVSGVHVVSSVLGRC